MVTSKAPTSAAGSPITRPSSGVETPGIQPVRDGQGVASDAEVADTGDQGADDALPDDDIQQGHRQRRTGAQARPGEYRRAGGYPRSRPTAKDSTAWICRPNPTIYVAISVAMTTGRIR